MMIPSTDPADKPGRKRVRVPWRALAGISVTSAAAACAIASAAIAGWIYGVPMAYKWGFAGPPGMDHPSMKPSTAAMVLAAAAMSIMALGGVRMRCAGPISFSVIAISSALYAAGLSPYLPSPASCVTLAVMFLAIHMESKGFKWGFVSLPLLTSSLALFNLPYGVEIMGGMSLPTAASVFLVSVSILSGGEALELQREKRESQDSLGGGEHTR